MNVYKHSATHGVPEVVVSDNGTTFTSTEFAQIMTKNGICHVKITPHHPSSNGLTERPVKTFNRPVASSSTLVQPSLRACHKGRGKSEGCAEHNQHAKHAIARGSGGMPSRKIFKITCSEIEFEGVFKNIIANT